MQGSNLEIKPANEQPVVYCLPSRMKRLDPLSPAARSQRMSLIRSKNTKPERVVASLIRSLGVRASKHGKTLPGNPDFVIRRQKKAIFVHGCFWHLHTPCNHYRFPRTRAAFWTKKLEGNRARDRKSLRELKAKGWRCLVIWECQLKKRAPLLKRLAKFLEA